ncbi:MAG: hypothetical protein AAB019_10940 [Planctomycetota bacterium]
MITKYEKASKKSARRTDLKHRKKIGALTGLNRPKLNKFFPAPADRQKLARLIKIVGGATSENKKMSTIKTNISDLAGTVLALVKYIKSLS